MYEQGIRTYINELGNKSNKMLYVNDSNELFIKHNNKFIKVILADRLKAEPFDKKLIEYKALTA